MIHSIIRFGGLWNPMFIPLSMIILWPLPWLLSNRPARKEMGFKAPISWKWFLIGPSTVIIGLALCVLLAWGVYGNGKANWFISHAKVMHHSLAQIPSGTSTLTKFWIVTIPAMIFSPFAEEFLFRGFMLTAFSIRWGFRAAIVIQATAFALVHLAHYGLQPFQPALIAVWLPSMFVVALFFGWLVRRSGSIWCVILSHSIFNLAMNGVVFLMLPNIILSK